MTPLQKDPKQLWTIRKRVVYKNGLKDTRHEILDTRYILKDNPGAAGEFFFGLWAQRAHGPTSSDLPNPELEQHRLILRSDIEDPYSQAV